MAATIISRIISSVQDNRIALSNGQFARALAIGSDWNSIRVGVRWIMGNTGADLTGTPRLAVGLCSGTTNLFGDATTTHFAGMVSNVATWTYSGGATPLYFGAGSANHFVPATRVGSTLTTGGSFGQYCRINAVLTDAFRTVYFVDIIKGSPNFSFKEFIKQSGNIDVTLDVFLNHMQDTTPVITNHVYTTTPVALAVSEANGLLNTVNVSWNQANPVIEISDIAVARLG